MPSLFDSTVADPFDLIEGRHAGDGLDPEAAPEEVDEFGSVRSARGSMQAKRKATKPQNHVADSIDRIRKDLGLIGIRADRTVQRRIGPSPSDVITHTEDLMGFMDVLAFPMARAGVCVAVQITTKGLVAEHIRKMCRTEKPRRGEPMCRAALDYWMGSGQQVLVVGWEQPGGKGTKWLASYTWVTPEIIAKIDSRRRS